jgi:hypothetical protein
MAVTYIPASNRSLISTFGNYYNRSSNAFSGIFGSSTYPLQSLSNMTVSYYQSSTYLIYCNIASSNSTKGSVSITYPWSETSSGTSTIGNNRQATEYYYGSISINANTNYPYTWNGWYTLPSSGTLISNQKSNNIGNGSYTGVWYAVWN